ncbi:MAG: hypothetical protein ACPGYV_11405 [Phycisphaeraceae bacterium]
MITPKYWARAAVDEDGIVQQNVTEESWGFQGVGWSDISKEDAYRHALERAKRIADNFKSDGVLDDLWEQYYTDRPLREPVINVLDHADQRIAVITQNIYGAYVLNTARAMFIDIDVPKPKEPGVIGRLLGKKPPPEPERSPIDRVRDTIQNSPGLGMKVYRTPNGYRGLVTSAPYTPGSDQSQALLNAFESDALYTKLCLAQQCFRARLTPKPWRIGMDNPPRTFPFTNPSKQRVFDQWKAQYDQRAGLFAACEPLSDEPWGNPTVHPEIAPVLAMHDELACSSGKPLA